ncbi:MAG TPA: ferric reductase-like transmembrane domain-containing protein [Acidimicrobiales bacterium]|nr:ferric reductase-like transmembrane domain-containing protein [Acidimicrobiales bacterium]
MSSIDLWYTTRATGIAALVLLTVVVVLGLLAAGRAKASLPAYSRVDLHRRISALAAVFLAIHVLTSVFDSYVHIDLLSVVLPYASGYKPGWVALGAVSVDLFVAVAVSSIFRQKIPARLWRGFHWLSYASWPVGVAHAVGIGTDMRLDWVLALVATCIASAVAVGSWRLVVSLQGRQSLPATVVNPRRSLRTALQQGRL